MTQENAQQEKLPAGEENKSEEKSFAEMFNENEATQDRLEPGQKVRAEIVRITKEWIFIDLGGKSEGALALAELLDQEGNPTVKEGDAIDVYFLAVERNEKIFTTKIGGAAVKAHLEEAFHSGIPVEGTIQKEIKGGFEVRIGGSRAFCPFSQMGLRKSSDNDQYIGQQYAFKIVEFKEHGKSIIVSHRKILEEQRAALREEMRESLQVGQTVKGVITSIRDFGAFVDIGGIEGLIPVSEIGWDRVSDIHSVLEEGQNVEVMIKGLDWDHERFSFSLRETLPDPWETCTLVEGAAVTGTVARLTDFGAFVTLAPGIDGLLHISALGGGRRINHPREVVRQGQSLEVRLDSIDREKKRISLSLPQNEETVKVADRKKSRKPQQDDLREEFHRFKETGGEKKEKSMGTFADLLKKKIGS
ncbi:MAG: 30S ribosomal protein S1 [Desulfurivibrio sp.]|nr:MAG: 30S ribosomal protein S1 [Desulfurivibrio sp.]